MARSPKPPKSDGTDLDTMVAGIAHDLRHIGPAPEIVDGLERPVGTRGDDLGAVLVGQAAHLPKAEANRELVVVDRLQRAVPP
jgi:hypothetical protein